MSSNDNNKDMKIDSTSSDELCWCHFCKGYPIPTDSFPHLCCIRDVSEPDSEEEWETICNEDYKELQTDENSREYLYYLTYGCLECGKRFRGNQSKVNKSMLLHTKYNHPEHLQERSNEVKTRIKTKDYDTNMLIGKYGTDEHNKSSKHLFFKSMLEYHVISPQTQVDCRKAR